MDILKKGLLLVSFTGIFIATKAQENSTAAQKAFSSSYAYEANYDYGKAIDALKTLYDEKSYEINLRLGWLHYINKQYPTAIKYYQKAIDLMPYSIEAKFGIIYPYAAVNNWDAVIVQYKEILKVAPENVTANYRLGLTYYNKVNYKDAAPYFEKYLNLYPFDYDAVIMSAWNNLKLGKKAEARLLFTKALLLVPADKSASEGLSLSIAK